MDWTFKPLSGPSNSASAKSWLNAITFNALLAFCLKFQHFWQPSNAPKIRKLTKLRTHVFAVYIWGLSVVKDIYLITERSIPAWLAQAVSRTRTSTMPKTIVVQSISSIYNVDSALTSPNNIRHLSSAHQHPFLVAHSLQPSPCQPSRQEQTPGVGQWPRPPAF